MMRMKEKQKEIIKIAKYKIMKRKEKENVKKKEKIRNVLKYKGLKEEIREQRNKRWKR